MRHLRRIALVLAVLSVVWGVVQTLAPRMSSTGELSLTGASAPTSDNGVASVPTVTNTATQGQYPNGFSYSCLTEAQQAVYSQLLQGVTSGAASFSIDCPDTDDIEPSLRALLEDHPELFWLDGSATYQRSSLLGTSVTITPTTNVDLSQVEGIQQEIDAEVDAWLSALPDGASDYDKVRSAYEWVIQNTDYDLTASQNQNIQSVFLGHESVCAGYAKAFQYLLHRAGVWCAYLTGQIESGQHAWNLVRIDGTYTYCDPTWGDPTYFTSQGETVEGNITYDYLCLTTAEMERDHHVADRADSLPTCDSDLYDWYRLHGTYLTSLDSQAISDAFWAAVDAGESEVGFKFADDGTYAEATSLLTSNRFLQNSLAEYGRRRGESQVSYSYTMAPELRVVRVFW